MFKKYRVVPLALAAACLICGLILLFNSSAASRSVFRILGVLALVAGGVRLSDEYSIAHKVENMQKTVLTRGCIECAAGLFLILFTGFVLNIISFVVGLALLGTCAYLIWQAMYSSTKGTPGWWAVVAACAAGAVFSLVMMCGGINVVGLVIRVAGLALAIYGGYQILDMYKKGQLF